MKLTIGNIAIHQDAEGRYSLNDLHEASGGDAAHQPALFLRNDQTQSLISEIFNSTDLQNKNPVVSKPGRYGGTYASKELVYAYAMWISPKFHLTVIRTFDAVVTGDTEKAEQLAKPSVKLNPARLFPDYFKVAKLIGCDSNLAAISANNAVFQKTGENVLKLLGHTHLETPEQQLYFNVSDLVDGISGQRMNKLLTAAGLQTRDGDRWIPTEDGQAFSRIYDTGKRHGDGMPVQAVRWTRDVLSLLSLDVAA